MDLKEKDLLHQMSLICHQIARGHYEALQTLEEMTIEGRYPKPIADLAESFSLMILKLQGREYELKKARERLEEKNVALQDKIHTLKIDIDVLKKAKEVARITETHFFQSIQQKTKKHRKSHE